GELLLEVSDLLDGKVIEMAVFKAEITESDRRAVPVCENEGVRKCHFHSVDLETDDVGIRECAADMTTMSGVFMPGEGGESSQWLYGRS
ncbi:MAG: hypothetical protein M3Q46_02330, partial [Verrucomicrobiota bacterium]|nr:hypothetical protein [Verrucomicrobiota bacterium]